MIILKKANEDKLSKLNPEQIKELLLRIDDIKLKYRDKLDLPKFVTFGVEIEFEDANTESVKRRLYLDFPEWKFDRDPSVTTLDLNDESLGGEVISPVLKDNDSNWQEIFKVCSLLDRCGASISDLSGGHIHFGTQVLGYNKKYWLNLIKLWIIYEPLIYRFSFGERLGPRAGIFKFAVQLDKVLLKNLSSFENSVNLYELLSYFPIDKYYSFNTCYVNPVKKGIIEGNTVEVRCPNGTVNPVIWQNNINFFAKLFLYCSDNNFDSEFINYKLDYLKDGIIHYDYNDIYIDEALELSDLVFSRELDKLYFLKQYLKDFSTINCEADKKRIFKL